MGSLFRIPRNAAFAVALLALLPIATLSLNVTVSTNAQQYSPGQSVTISGKVLDSQNNAVSGASVSVEVDSPQNTQIYVQLVGSDQSGNYHTDPFILPANTPSGQYSVHVSASKTGYNTGQAQTQFTVQNQSASTTTTHTTSTSQPPGVKLCVIATAAYGSELSPEVQLLRNFRDAKVLRTSAGGAFMVAFNTVYYSFSPTVAQYVSAHQPVSYVTRILLYPLIGILAASNMLFDSLAFFPEFSVIVVGGFAAFMIGFVYLGPATLLIRKSRRINWTVMTIIVGLSLATLAVAEIAQQQTLLMIGASSTVIAFIKLGATSFRPIIQLLSKRA